MIIKYFLSYRTFDFGKEGGNFPALFVLKVNISGLKVKTAIYFIKQKTVLVKITIFGLNMLAKMLFLSDMQKSLLMIKY